MNLFVYDTLMFPAVQRTVLGRTRATLFLPATGGCTSRERRTPLSSSNAEA